jgi:hypothetical protein
VAVAFGSGSGTTYTGRTNTVVTAPTGITSGDLLLLFFVVGGGLPVAVPTPPSGFLTIDPSLPADQFDNSGFHVFSYCWSKIAGASEPGTYTITHTTANGSQAWMGRYTGVSPTSTFSPAPTFNKTSGGATGGDNNTIALGLTTTLDGTGIVILGQDWGDNANDLPGPTGGTPTFLERHDVPIMYVCDGVMATAGATGNKNFTNHNSGAPTSQWTSVMVALAPSGGAPPPVATAGVFMPDLNQLGWF